MIRLRQEASAFAKAPADKSPDKPGPTSFADLAVELKLIAWREAAAVEHIEFMAAKSGQAEFFAALREARLGAERVGEACELLKALIPVEREVRQLLAAHTPHPSPSATPSPTRGEGCVGVAA